MDDESDDGDGNGMYDTYGNYIDNGDENGFDDSNMEDFGESQLLNNVSKSPHGITQSITNQFELFQTQIIDEIEKQFANPKSKLSTLISKRIQSEIEKILNHDEQ